MIVFLVFLKMVTSGYFKDISLSSKMDNAKAWLSF